MARTLDPGDRSTGRAPERTERGRAFSGHATARRITKGSSANENDERAADSNRFRADRPTGPTSSPREPSDRIRRSIATDQRSYNLNADERETLIDLGRFRVIAASDLVQFRYGGHEARLRQDTRSLLAQDLIQFKTIWVGRPRAKETFYSLTPSGKRLAKRELPTAQAAYAGFVKPAELCHDAAIYRMYHREAEQITRDGGHVRRVVLDFELKKKAYSRLAKAKALPPPEYLKRQGEIARELGLKIVNGHIALPDLRIEYETRSGGSAQVDLEVASGSYHGSHAAEKAAAGFRIYASPETATRLTAALEEREITAEILAL